jgi:adenosylmethionine---8-amino-7-oxononanoate aminotransferase
VPKPSGLIARDAARVWHPYTQMLTRPEPLAIVRGDGVYLYTADGRRLLDGFSSWWVNIHGHSHPRLNEALAAQAGELEHVVFANCTHAPAVELAERLVGLLPDGLTRVFYSDNGSTAVEVAMKIALQYWGNQGRPRRTFITLEHAYHGDTVGAMSASEDSIFTRPFASMLFNVVRAPSPYAYRCALDGPAKAGRHEEAGRHDCTAHCLDAMEARLAEHNGDVAAVLVEPMLQGAGGMIMWPAEYLRGLRRLCDAHDTLLIADEVLTGFGRTGRLFACEHAGISPDIICLSKALTGGYLPLGATVVSERVYEAFLSTDRTHTLFHGHSFTANPLACAVALASLDLIESTNAVAKVQQIEGWLRDGLEPLRDTPLAGDIRILGDVGVVELVADKRTREAGGYLDEIGPRLTRAFLERGLLLRPLGNVVYVMPPYVITQAETEWMLEQVRDVVGAIIRS